MAVILTGMEMPKNCVECNRMGLQETLNCPLIFSGCANCGRHPNCPLKSVDGLIEKIGNLSDTYMESANTITVYSWEGMQKKVIDIIKEYCGIDKEITNGTEIN